MRAQFIRGQDPKDSMELGDVKGRKLKNIADILVREFEKIFEELFKENKYLLPKFEVDYQETNVGFGNRDSWETDTIEVITEYKEFRFALGWKGNPLNSEVPQKFTARWAKLQRGASDMSSFNTSNQALWQLEQWIKNV